MADLGQGEMSWQDKVNRARSAGYSWEDINGYENELKQKAQSAGYSQDDINGYFGKGNPSDADQRFQQGVKLNNYNYDPKPAQNWWEDFKAGVERSSGGLLVHGQPTTVVDPQHSTFLGRLIAQTGEIAGDVPTMIAGSVGGSTAGGAAGASAGALVPGAGETGTSEVVGGAIGAVAGGGAGAMALPQFIKDEYADALAHGRYENAEDFFTRQLPVLWDTTKAGAIGAVTAGAAKFGGPRVAQALGATGITAKGVHTATALAALTTASAVAKGQWPDKETVVDNALILGGLKLASVPAERLMSPIRQNLIRNWRDTGQSPRDAATQARNDPYFRQNIVTPQPSDPPAGSSTTKTDAGDFIIPRISKTFDEAADWVLKHEGGTTTDTGGLTKFGISSKAHPDVDVKNLTLDQAKEIYHSQYWRAIGADNLPENMRLAAFDSAINQGVEPTKTWLKEADGNLQTFLSLRSQEYARLAQNEKYSSYAKSWGKRLADLGFRGTFGEPPEPPQPPSEGPEETDPWKIVGSHISEPDKGPSFGDRFKDTAYQAYTDLFNPLHPINRLTQAAVNGGVTLDDAENPEFLHRIAEHHSELAQYAIQKDMIDLQGKKVGPSLNSIIEPFGKTDEDLGRFWTYAAARWALEKSAQGKATGIADSPARQVAAEGEAKFGAAFDALVNWQNQSLGWMKDAGILSKENYDKWVSDNKARIPGYRVMEEPKPSGGTGRGRTAFNPIKEFKGSERPIRNIYQSLMQDAFLRMELAQHNRANAATLDLAEKLGLAEVKDKQAVPIKISADELARQGFKSEDENEDVDATIFRLARQKIGANEVPVFRDGKMDVGVFDDPNIARVIKGMDQQTRSVFQKMAQPFTRFMRGSIVLNPLFPVRLMTYDIPWQFITKPGMRNTLADVYTGLKAITTNSAQYDEWMRSGGAERVFDGLNKQQYIRKMLADHGDPAYTEGAWNKIRNGAGELMAYAKIWGNSLSQAQRVGRFINAPEGESRTRTAIASADAAFHRSSFGGPLGKTINSVQPFTAAYLNSLEQTFRAFTGHALTGEKVYDNKTVALNYMKAMGVITIPMLANWAMNRDKEWYKAAPDWQKDNGLLINVGSDDGLHAVPLFIKFPPLVSFLFGGLPRRIMDRYVADNPHAFDGISKGIGGAALPPGGLLTYNVMTPIIEHMANYSFFRGHALVNEDVKRSMLPPQQANAYSTAFAKNVSKYVNDVPLLKNMSLSPPVIDNYVSGWGGTLGVAATKLMSNDPKLPAWHVTDYPLISSWLSRYPSANAQPIVDFQNRMDALGQAHGSIAQLFKQHDLQGMTDLANENPVAANMHRFNERTAVRPDDIADYANVLRGTRAQVDQRDLMQLARTDKALKNLKIFASQVYAQDANKMSATDKQQLLDQTYAIMQVTAERGNDLLDKMHVK